MLSSTYVQVAMQLENDRLREGLALLTSRTGEFCDSTLYLPEALENLLCLVSRLCSQCCFRRLEVYFLPEMQKQIPESCRLIADHEVLRQSSINLHTAVCLGFYQAFDEGTGNNAWIRSLVAQYCQTVFCMLETEENTIFSIAQAGFSRESWFSLARIFMYGEEKKTNRRIMIDPGNGTDNCFLSINTNVAKTDMDLKHKVSDKSGSQGPEILPLHFGSGQRSCSRIHSRQVV